MPAFDQQEFDKFVVDNNVYGFFREPITLKSGRQSHFYANWRNVVEDAWLTGQLVEFVLRFVDGLNLRLDTFYGVPEGATKLGVLAQYTWASRREDFGPGSHVLAMGRAKPKDHGAPKDKFFVGMPRGRVIVLEDVTTTGGSSLMTLTELKEAGLNVTALVSLTNRMEMRDDGLSVKTAVERFGVPYFHMSSALDVLPLVFEKQKPGAAIGHAIEEEFARYGVQPLKLL